MQKFNIILRQIVHVLYSCEFYRMPLVSTDFLFLCQNCPHYNMENDFLDMDKT